MKSFLLTVAALCIAVFFVSCSKEKEIKFQEDVPLALAPDIQWAVVVDPYAAYHEGFDWDTAVIGHCRKGDILEVKGNAVFNERDDWYYFDGGWLPETAVDIYSNRFKAVTAVGQLK